MEGFEQQSTGGGRVCLECQKRKGQSTLEEFFPGENVEAEDDNMQWLSEFVEECLSGSPTDYSAATITDSSNYSPTTTTATTTTAPTTPSISPSPPAITSSIPISPLTPTAVHALSHRPRLPQNSTSKLKQPKRVKHPQPAKAPTRPVRVRKRRADNDDCYVYFMTGNNTTTKGAALFHKDHDDQAGDDADGAPPDSQLLQQAYWMAESELVSHSKPLGGPLPASHHQSGRHAVPSAAVPVTSSSTRPHAPTPMLRLEDNEVRGGHHQQDDAQLEQLQPTKRCTHCQSYETPQWRAGPMGPRTLCNACGVRYKSGRLLPEYRPARSPTFESCKHSNSHRKVLAMRTMAVHLSSSTPSR